MEDIGCKIYQLSTDFSTITYASERLFPVPKNVVMYESNNQLFVYDKAQALVFAYDALGTFKKKIPVQPCQYIHFQNDAIEQYYQGNIHRFNLNTLSEDSTQVLGSNIIDAIHYKNSLLVLTPKGISLLLPKK
jgi:hypothetical protein